MHMQQMMVPYISGYKKFKEYGKLSHKNLDDLQSGNRALQVSGEDQKEDPPGFCALETKERRRTLLGISMVQRTSGLAYRVLCNV